MGWNYNVVLFVRLAKNRKGENQLPMRRLTVDVLGSSVLEWVVCITLLEMPQQQLGITKIKRRQSLRDFSCSFFSFTFSSILADGAANPTESPPDCQGQHPEATVDNL